MRIELHDTYRLPLAMQPNNRYSHTLINWLISDEETLTIECASIKEARSCYMSLLTSLKQRDLLGSIEIHRTKAILYLDKRHEDVREFAFVKFGHPYKQDEDESENTHI